MKDIQQNEDSRQIEKIYNELLDIEHFCELKKNPPLTGIYAKRLLKKCKDALQIISKYNTDLKDELKHDIEEMEDQLSEDDKIRIITFNLGARIKIHVSIEWVNRWDKI